MSADSTAQAALPETLTVTDTFPEVSYEQWRELVEKDLKGAPFEKKLVTHTYEGIDLQPLYTARDWPAGAPADASGFPGAAPMTRGTTAVGAIDCGWDIRQEFAEPRPQQVNEAIIDDLAHGVTSAHLRLDLSSRNALPPDAREAEGRVGRDGCMLHTLDDYEAALEGVHIEMITVGLEAGASFIPAAASLAALWEKREITPDKRRASFNADPLAVLSRDGKLPVPTDEALAQMADLACWTVKNAPKSTSVRVGTGPYHHAGATAAQDLAFSMATAVEYLRTLTGAGLTLEQAAGQLLFNFNVGTNFFLAIAKLRAARTLWARVIEAAGGGTEAQQMLIQARTSKRVITQRDPWVNMLRNTVTSFAAAVAGAQIITTEPFDKALGTPDEFSRRIARNTQIVLQEESHLTRVLDPAGGCWFVESLTDQLCEKAWPIFQEIEKLGGMAKAIETGWVGEQIDSAFTSRLKNISTRREAVTGVSEFPNLSEELPEKQPEDLYDLRSQAVARLALHRASGLPETKLSVLRELSQAARAGEREPGTITQAMIGVIASGAHLAEAYPAIISGDFGPQLTPIAPHPYAEPFEELRDASDAFAAATGQRPKVFLASVGTPAHYTARQGFAKNFFEAGGFESVMPEGVTPDADGIDAAVTAATDSGANTVVICSSDKLYPEVVPALATKLHKAGVKTVVLAGHPGENEETYKAAGVDRCIFIKCDVLAILRELLTEEGVLS